MPLRPNPEASIRAVINHLMAEYPSPVCIDSPMDEAVSYRRRTGHIVGSAITKRYSGCGFDSSYLWHGLAGFALSWSDRGSNDGSFALWHIFGSRSPPLHVSDFVDRFPVLPGDGYSHPPSDFPTYMGLIWVGLTVWDCCSLLLHPHPLC